MFRPAISASRNRETCSLMRCGTALARWVAFILVSGACSIGGSGAAVGSPQPVSTAAFHRITVRGAEFYDRTTQDRFVARGTNYIRLAPQTDVDGTTIVYHSTFNPGRYDAGRAETALSRMHADGYNSVRVFTDWLAIAGKESRLSQAYLRNMADFIRRAQSHSIHVMVVGDEIPAGYRLAYQSGDQLVSWENLIFLTPGGVEAGRHYWRDLVTGLNAVRAPTDQVWAFELYNEAFYFIDRPPLNLNSGVVATGNGHAYDMSSPIAKQQMMDENLVFWVDQVRDAVREVDPSALVGIGFAAPQKPHPWRVGDARAIRTQPVLTSSQADFVDLHLYAGEELSLAQFMDNFEEGARPLMPIVMGEFGASTAAVAPTHTPEVLQAWQAGSCRFGFAGWLFWTWDTDEQPGFINVLGHGGVVNSALAPKNRPDPCAPPTVENLAFGRPVTASRSLPDSPPAAAVDGSLSTSWNAGAPAPQWIEVDLGSPHTINRIVLTVSQSPSGNTTHRVSGRGTASEPYRLLQELHGMTTDQQAVELKPTTSWENVRFLKVETLSSPSWVAWREVEVYG